MKRRLVVQVLLVALVGVGLGGYSLFSAPSGQAQPTAEVDTGACVGRFESQIDASDPQGALTALAAIQQDKYASLEVGLVETAVDDSYSIFSNATSTYAVYKISGQWVVLAGERVSPAACSGVSPFTGEVLSDELIEQPDPENP